ncbi:MAG: ferredoxin [Gaiellaceae bacterium]
MSDEVLRVNPIRCEAHGLCAELFPEWIRLDDWGYPIIDQRPVPRGLERHARRAIAECPALALMLARAGDVRQLPRPRREPATPLPPAA